MAGSSCTVILLRPASSEDDFKISKTMEVALGGRGTAKQRCSDMARLCVTLTTPLVPGSLVACLYCAGLHSQGDHWQPTGPATPQLHEQDREALRR